MANPAIKHRIGITGACGFIGSHLFRQLGLAPGFQVAACPREAFQQPAALGNFVRQCDTVIHLAGLSSGSEQDIYETNLGLVERLVEALTASQGVPHVIFASSMQRDRATAFGRSKKVGESRLREWAKQRDARLKILIIPNVFGPGCRPYYNSTVATFCDQLCHDQQPVLLDDQALSLVWINDLVEAIVQILEDDRPGIHEVRVAGSAQVSTSELLAKLQSMCDGYFDTNTVPNLADPFDANLFTTFLSHVELDDHRHRPKLYADARGELYEIMRLAGGGQIFFSTTKPGAIRGNHFHSRKVEWFCVVRGEAVIRIRRVGGDHVREFRVSGAKPEFISIPPLHMHQIENVGNEDLLTMFWCNEVFSPADPDTFHESVA